MRATHFLRQLRQPEMRGHLVDANSPSVRIIKHSGFMQLDENLDNEELRPREKRDILTIEGRSPSSSMAQLPVVLSQRINDMTKNSEPQLIRQKVAQLFKKLQNGGSFMPALEAADVDVHIQGLFLQNYVSCVNALKEIKKRQPDFVPKSILDVGFGPATGILAAREVFGNDMEETCVVLGHPRMRMRAKDLLKTENSEELTKFRYDIPGSSSPKRFDLIIAQHQLYQTGRFNEELADSHSQQLARLCSDDGVALFIERGDPLGFEAVSLARDHFLRPKYKYGVVGPCTHNKKCPLQAGLTVRESMTNPARENWCRFTQNVERPRYTKELKRGQYLAQKWVPGIARGAGGTTLKGGGRPGCTNYEAANFSWVALRNGLKRSDEADNANAALDETAAWPRILKTPYKRQGHVIMQVCTPAGEIEQWTVPKSQGKQAYHDVRKADAGDLWALDAKVKQRRGGLRFVQPENDGETGESNGEDKVSKTTSSKKPSTKEACIDWWLPKSNPYYKHGSHQARIHAENLVEPEDDSFVGTMSKLMSDEGRESKITKRELQQRYR